MEKLSADLYKSLPVVAAGDNARHICASQRKKRININYTSHCRPDQNWIPMDAGKAAQRGSKPGTTVRQRQLPVASCSSRLWQFQVPWAHISLARLGASQTERSRTAHKAAVPRQVKIYGNVWPVVVANACAGLRSISKKSFRLSWVRRKTCHFYFNDQRWSKMSAQANATTISLLSYFFNCLLFCFKLTLLQLPPLLLVLLQFLLHLWFSAVICAWPKLVMSCAWLWSLQCGFCRLWNHQLTAAYGEIWQAMKRYGKVAKVPIHGIVGLATKAT